MSEIATTPTTQAPAATPEDVEAVAERVLDATTAALETLTIHVGLELGLYAALADGPATPADLAERAQVGPRYAREWLEQQTAAGIVSCLDPRVDPEHRIFTLPPAVAAVLLDPASGAYLGPLLGLLRGVTDVVEPLLTAYRTGAGVPYHAYGAHLRHGLGGMNGAAFDTQLADWIAALPDVHERLTSAPTPRILDLGCGVGRSTLALARAYPRAVVHGVDLDEASIADARAAAAAAGLADRVTFTVGDAAALADGDRYDLVTIFEALHDMGDPVGVLTSTRSRLAEGGTVYVADERVADEFGPNADLVERLQFGFSVLHCLPATLAEEPVLANGTVLRAPTMREWARQAGYVDAVDLDVEDLFWRHYRLDPASDR